MEPDVFRRGAQHLNGVAFAVYNLVRQRSHIIQCPEILWADMLERLHADEACPPIDLFDDLLVCCHCLSSQYCLHVIQFGSSIVCRHMILA
jgi:hypothetical protein